MKLMRCVGIPKYWQNFSLNNKSGFWLRKLLGLFCTVFFIFKYFHLQKYLLDPSLGRTSPLAGGSQVINRVKQVG